MRKSARTEQIDFKQREEDRWAGESCLLATRRCALIVYVLVEALLQIRLKRMNAVRF